MRGARLLAICTLALSLAWTSADGRAESRCAAGCAADKDACRAAAASVRSATLTACPAGGAGRRRCVRQALRADRAATLECARVQNAVCLPCCNAGGDACSGLPTAAARSMALQGSPIAFDRSTAEMTLGTGIAAAFTLASPRKGGTVTLSAIGVPPSWEATFLPSADVTVGVDGTAQATLVVSVPTDGEATTATIGVIAAAAGAAPEAAGTLDVTALDQMIVAIPPGTHRGDHSFPAQLTLRPGTVLSFRNDDTEGHVISSDGDPFPPQDTSTVIGSGQSYDVVVGEGTTRFHCHAHGAPAGMGTLTVQ